MKFTWNRFAVLLAIACTVLSSPLRAADQVPAETKLSGPDEVAIVVRMQGPYDAEVPLQIVCYFERTEDSDKRLKGAPVELDKRLGGIIAALRARGEFDGNELETFLIDAPPDTIKAKQLLLIGLGDEAGLSLKRMEKVGKIAVREAVRLGATQVAFAPLIKDAGNDALSAGDVETAVIRGMLLALDTERRLSQQGFAKPVLLKTWIVEAGPTYYEETIKGVRSAISQAADKVGHRVPAPYSSRGK